MSTAAIYVRISRDIEGRSLGVQRQETECRELADRLGLTVTEVYVDNDVSATSGKVRPEFERLLAGPHKTVIVWAQDRLLRVSRDLERVLNAGMTVHMVTAGTLDLSTPAGRAVARTVTAWNTYEVEQKAERQRSANSQRRAKGERHRGGARAFGFERSMEHIPAEADALRDGYDHILTGGSVASLTRLWNERGVRTSHGNAWNRSGVRRALLNPANAGLASYSREVTGDGSWEPIVDRETWETVKAVLEAPERLTVRSDGRRRYLLPGLLTCGVCGAVMGTGRTSEGKRTYVCTAARHLSRKAEPVDEFVSRQFLARMAKPYPFKPDLSTRSTPRTDTSDIEARLDALALSYAEGRTGLREFEVATKALRERLEAAQAQQMAGYTVGVLKPFLVNPDEAWMSSAVDQRRSAIEAAVEKITVLPVKRGTRKFQPESVDIQWVTEGES